MAGIWLSFRYWMLLYRKTWRGTIVISVANPLLFLLGIGAGLGHLVDRHAPAGLAGVSYVAFVAPGLLAASAMQTGFVEGGGRVLFAAGRAGAYRAAVTTPLEPTQILAGHLAYMAFRLLSSSAAFVIVMIAFRVSNGWWAAAVLPAALLTGMAFAAPIAAWTVGVRSYTQLNTLFRFLIMPMYMFSGTFFAIAQLPRSIRWLAYALPLWHGVQLCRTLSLGTATVTGSAVHAGYLLALAIAGALVARSRYRGALHA